MSKPLPRSQQSAMRAVGLAHPAVSFAVKSVKAHDALVRRGYATEAKVPLVARYGLKLTAAGLKYIETGEL